MLPDRRSVTHGRGGHARARPRRPY